MKRLLALSACAAITAGAALPASAQVVQDPSSGQTIVVPKDKSAAFRLDYPASEIVVAAPDTLSLVATTDRSFYVRGKALGVTNILVYDKQHRLAQVIDVHVCQDMHSLQTDLETALPGEHIIAASFAGGVLLSGGFGSVTGIVLGTMIYGIVSLGLFYTGWPTDWLAAFIGALLVIAVLTNNIIRELALSSGRKKA